MKVGRMEEKEAELYICKRLNEVKEILDDIAEKTGLTYIVLDDRFVEMFGKVGSNLIFGLQEIMKIVPDRMDLANQAKQSAFVANFEDREKFEQRKEMRSILEELIIRSKDGLKADLLELKEKYSNFDDEEKK